MSQKYLVGELNMRLVNMYDEFRQRGIGMPEYMAMLASHCSALLTFQEDPEAKSQAFCDDLMRGVTFGLADLARMRSQREIARIRADRKL